MVYVMSDIHGNLERFNSVMSQINLQPEDTLYVLGDVADRFPDGIEILLKLMSMPNVKMLLGNHDYMLSKSVKLGVKSGIFDIWEYNGGNCTYKAFMKLPEEDRKRIIEYIDGLPLNIDIEVSGKKYKLVHGSPLDWFGKTRESLMYRDAEEYAIWGRIRRHDGEGSDYTVIFGHTPTINYQYSPLMSIWYGKNLIGIDCGSGFADSVACKYRLACLRLDDMKEFYSEVKAVDSSDD